MNELLIILYFALSGGLFALGGTTWKGWRRFVLPAITSGFLYIGGLSAWLCLGAGLAQWGVNSLGYGENKPYEWKLFVGCMFTVPAIVAGLNTTWWTVALPGAFLILFYLSNWTRTAKHTPWKSVEFMIGTFQAASIVAVLP